MASVWRAHDPVLDREVAVKRLHAALIDDKEFADRFDREARMIAGVSHPNVVRLLDRGHDDDGPYLVLELVEGETLKQRVQRDGPMPEADAAALCAQIARGLAVAHEQGIVHRDIKSQNVLLSADGVAKLTDFGIARLQENADMELTRTGMLVGSADYLSPEQAAGDMLDTRSDIYSLGVVLFEALTNTLPYSAESVVAVAMKHVAEPFPDPRDRGPGISEHLANCVLRATAKKPEDRFADAAAFAEALEGAPVAAPRSPDADTHTMELPAAASVSDAPGKRGFARLAVGLFAVVVAVGALLYLVGVNPFDRGGSGGAEAAAPAPLIAELAADLDPEGDRTEGRSTVTNAIDGDEETSWSTERYTSAGFGSLKTKVGLSVTFAGLVVADAMEISTPLPGALFEVRASESGPVLASGTMPRSGRFALESHPATSEYQVWITRLVEDPERGSSQRPFSAAIGQVAFVGVANPSGDGSVE